MKKVNMGKVLSITGYTLLLAGFIIFISQLKEGLFLIQLGFILGIAGLGTILISYDLMLKKLKAENHKLRKDVIKLRDIIPGV